MKKKLFSIILATVMIAESILILALPISAWSWITDGECEVPTYNATVAEDNSITVDALLDEAYIGGTVISSYPDAEPYRRKNYDSVWDNARGNFEAYIAADTKGLYVYNDVCRA